MRLLVLAGTLLLLIAGAPAQPGLHAQDSFYTAQPGDTWTSIAWQHRIPLHDLWRINGVTNPILLTSGLRLYISHSEIEPTTDLLRYALGPTESLWLVALRGGTSPYGLMTLNALSCTVGAPGQEILVPDLRARVAWIPSATATIPVPPVSSTLPPPQSTPMPEGTLARARLGIQGHFSIPDNDRRRLLDMVAYNLEFTWVKQQVDWSLIEYAPGQYSVELEKLDLFVDDAFNRNLNVLLSVAKAPDWARSTIEEHGPPLDYNRYYDFLRFLVLRYKFKIQAVEVWNEPNLRREWNGAPLSGAEYVRLLAGAYPIIKEGGGHIQVISGAPAPTGISDGIVAVDDRTYLRQMYEAGLPDHADAIGIHPYGWANPPWTRCCGDSGGVPTHNDHPSFFFLNTIEDYRAIQTEFGDQARPLWATEFGWGTMDGLDVPIPDNAAFFAYTDQLEQAEYILQAFLMGQSWDFMGPMFLWNLNISTLDGFDPAQAGFSILIEIDRPRPAYNALRDTPKLAP